MQHESQAGVTFAQPDQATDDDDDEGDEFRPVKKTCTLAASVVSKELTIASVTAYEINKICIQKKFLHYTYYMLLFVLRIV